MIKLFLIELFRTLTLTLRYPANFVSSLAISIFMFYGLFLGAQYLSGRQAFGTNLDAMIVGWTAWILATKALNKPAVNIQSEADTGVLESVFLSGYKSWLIFFVRALSETFVDLVLIVILVVALVFLTGSEVVFPPEIALPIAAFILAAIGMGLIVGGIALQIKRMSAILPILQLLLLFLMFTPFEELIAEGGAGVEVVVMSLPMVPSVVMLRGIMAFGHSFDQLLALEAVLNALVWLVIGLMVFRGMANRAKAKGLLAGY